MIESSPDQYISPIFALEKKDHSSRMILNLKKLNELVKYKKFKMDTFTSVAFSQTRLLYGIDRPEIGILYDPN